MVNVPTTCWILDTRHKAYKLFNIPEDPICDYPKYFNHKWGSWKFAIDMPHIQDQQGNYLVVDPGMTGANFMIECAVKICPNFIGNICESLIRQCNYEDIDIEE